MGQYSDQMYDQGYHEPRGAGFLPNSGSHGGNAAYQSDYYADPSHGHELDDLHQIKAALGNISQRLNGMQNNSRMPQPYFPQPAYDPDHELMAEIQGALGAINESIAGLSEQMPMREQFEQLVDVFNSKNGGGSLDELKAIVDASNQTVTNQINDLRTSISGSIAQSAAIGKTTNDLRKSLNAHQTEMKKSFASQQQSLQSQMTALQQRLDTSEGQKVDINFLQASHAELMEQISGMREQLNTAGGAASGSDAQAFENVEMRLEDVNRALAALSQGSNNIDHFERLEARIIDLAKSTKEASETSGTHALKPSLDAINAAVQALSEKVNSITHDHQGTAVLAQKIDMLSERMENALAVNAGGAAGTGDNAAIISRLDAIVERAGAGGNTGSFDAMTSKLEKMSERWETYYAQVGANSQSQQTAIFQKLNELGSLINTMGDASSASDQNAQMVLLENNLQQLSSQIANVGTSDIDVSPILSRLESIEGQVANSRDIAIELAAKAAEDAVQTAVQKMESAQAGNDGIDNSLIEALAQDIKAIQKSTVEAQNGSKTEFDAMTQHLKTMTGRLTEIEDAIHSNAASASASVTSNVSTVSNISSAEMTQVTPQEVAQNEIVEPVPSMAVGESQDTAAVAAPANSIGQALVQEAVRVEQMRKSEAAQSQAQPNGIPAEAAGLENFGEPQAPIQELGDAHTPSMQSSHADLNDSNFVPDQPIEPGAKGPDLAAMVRQANERRKSMDDGAGASSSTDFIAAARRAAQAAAEQANEAETEAKQHGEKPSKGLLASILGKRKKAIALTLVAVLLAAAAVPMAGKFLSGDGPLSSAGIKESVQSFLGGSSSQTTQSAEVQMPKLGSDSEPVDNYTTENVEPSPQPQASQAIEQPVRDVTAASAAPQQTNPEPQSLVSAPKADQVLLEQYAKEVAIKNPELKQSILEGDPAAMFEIGRRYTDGVGVNKDLDEAAKWYERAAKLEYAPAQYLIGNFLEKGLGQDKDINKAVEWYKRAANNGNIIAMHNLAVLYATPNAVAAQPDNKMAFSWFKQAADHGVRDSQVNLGIFYTKGVGTDVNLIEAYKWFDVAAKGGDKDAQSKRDIVSQALRPDQLDEAKKASGDWKAIEIAREANMSSPKREWMTTDSVVANTSPVARVQTMLSKLGYDVGTIDGIMGDKTRQAIARFQSQSGLPINGKISNEFLQKLQAQSS